MTPHRIAEQLDSLCEGCQAVYTRDELEQRLQGKKRLRVKLGMDPTAPDLTLGHTVVLRKLRQFQDYGHKAVLIIGDYTAMIGDPTGRSKARPVLTREQIDENAQSYFRQAGKVLDLSDEKLEIRNNSEWLSSLSHAEVIKLMSQMTVARMLERDTFAKRQASGTEIYLHELLYPIMQAYDSVVVESDVELGGTDQTFNNLCGRDFQRNAGQAPQIVMVVPLLVGIDGTEKMSKSLGNYVAITDVAAEMFGKLMRIPDQVMKDYFELLTDTPPDEVVRLTDPGQCNPRDGKEELAKAIVGHYHSAAAADAAADEFRRVHSGGGGGLPDEMPEVELPGTMLCDGAVVPIELILHCGFDKSRSGAKRIVAEGGIRLNGQVLDDPMAPVAVKTGDVLQRGKRRFVKLRTT